MRHVPSPWGLQRQKNSTSSMSFQLGRGTAHSDFITLFLHYRLNRQGPYINPRF